MKVEITTKQFREIWQWMVEKGMTQLDADMTIEVSHSSGIGPSVKAMIQTSQGEGCWKDVTDHSTW
jgi:hypothetical protein